MSTLIIEKINFEEVHNKISNDTILTQICSDDVNDCSLELKRFRLSNPKNLISVHLNINSLRNKFETTKNIIQDIFNISLISETKIDNSFPNGKFSINGYRIFWRDRNYFGIGLGLYPKERIWSKLLNFNKENIDTETTF